MRSVPMVHILTYCPHPIGAYRNLLVFDSIRKGFPTARIEVWDNESCPEVREAIQTIAKRVEADFHAMQRVYYADHLRWVLLEREHPEGVPLVLCDPDIVFWGKVEHWDFRPALVAGRLIPEMQRAGMTAQARLHPSLLFVPDVHALRQAVASVGAFAWDGIEPRTAFVNGRSYFWDTMANLTHALVARCRAFTPADLDCYDHLFCGTHSAALGASTDPDAAQIFTSAHIAAASGNVSALRGIWRAQQAVFESASSPVVADTVQTHASMLAMGRALAQAQGQRYSNGELTQAAVGTLRALEGHMTTAARDRMREAITGPHASEHAQEETQ